MSLEKLIEAKQDQLRGRPRTRWEIFYEDHVAHVDWSFVGFTVCLVVATACWEFVLIVRLIYHVET
jgi:hypothetical protein